LTASPQWRAPIAWLPLLLGSALLLVVAWREPPRRSERLDVYRIVPGTADRVAAGLPIDEVLPRRLETVAGASLQVFNDDVVSHVFGPFLLAPGQSWSQRYAMAGDYRVSCSLYPDTDLVIAVGAPARPPPVAARAHRLWTVLWAGLIALIAARVALALGEWRAAAVPMRFSLPSLAWALVSSTLILVALEVLELSRVAPWHAALASRGLPWWMAGLALALGAAVLAGLASERKLYLPALISLVMAVWLVAMAGLAPRLQGEAAGWALAVIGLGLVAAAVAATLRAGARSGHHAGIGRVGMAGAALVVAGLPWPLPAPAWSAAAGALIALVGTGVLTTALGVRPGVTTGTRWLLGLAGTATVVVGAAYLFLALLSHIEAVTVPLAGGMAPAAGAAVARGRHATPSGP